MKNFVLPMDIRAIMEAIPHRYPFLLIDRVIEAIPLEKVVALKNVSSTEPALQGHFPGNPVFPGVMLIEGLAQASAVLGHLSYENGLKECLLTEIKEARFRKPVVPGDVVRYEVTVTKRRLPFFWFDATAYVGDEVVATTKISALMK